jgi:hypothetical protein
MQKVGLFQLSKQKVGTLSEQNSSLGMATQFSGQTKPRIIVVQEKLGRILNPSQASREINEDFQPFIGATKEQKNETRTQMARV